MICYPCSVAQAKQGKHRAHECIGQKKDRHCSCVCQVPVFPRDFDPPSCALDYLPVAARIIPVDYLP